MNLTTPLEVVQAESLETLFAEAATLGGVRVWQHEPGDAYEVTIKFKRRSGSGIEAKDKNTVLAFALAGAINEARDLGAGSQP